VRVHRKEVGERTHYSIRVVRNGREVVLERKFVIYSDFPIFGGFVSALQADDDPELEIVAWGSLETGWNRDGCNFEKASRSDRSSRLKRFRSSYDRHSFYLDFQDGRIAERPFCMASDRAKTIASTWAYYHLRQPISVILVFVLATLFILVPAVVYFLVTRRKGRRI
jgi:hypothetical protein